MTQTVRDLTSVVVVSHRSAATLEQCLTSVLASSALIELIVVDNASDDGSAGLAVRLAAMEPRLRVVANGDNRGYAAACNQGAAIAGGDALLFLNPDAFVAGDTIAAMRAHLAADATIGLLGARVVDSRGRRCGPQRRREPTARRSLMTLTGLARLEPWLPALAGVEAPEPSSASPAAIEPVDAVNGAAMLVRRAAFAAVGGFDAAFRLHAEDLDLCRRLRDAGWRVARAGDVTIVHIGGVSGRRRPLWVEWQKTRSLWRYFRKHQPGAGVALRGAVAAGLALRLALKTPLLLLRKALAQRRPATPAS